MHRSIVLALWAGCVWAGDWAVDLVITPNPSPYVSDWESNPGQLTLSITYTGANPVNIKIYGRIKRNSTVIAEGSSDVISFSGPETRVYSNQDILSWSDFNYSSDFQEQVIRSGRFPEGTYTFCAKIMSFPMGDSLAGDCEIYTLVLPRPPTLFTPANFDTVNLPYPIFTWSPLTAPPNYTIHYKFSLWEMVSGQTPSQAASGIPIFVDTTEMTMLNYPLSAPELEDGHTYVWQVQSLDSIYQPFGQNQGKSEYFVFTYSPIVGPPSRLGDTLTIVEDAAYLVISGISIEETPTSYILSGSASLLLPVLSGVPPITVGVSNLEVSKSDLSIVGGSFNAPDLDPSIIPEAITGYFIRLTGLNFDVTHGLTFSCSFRLPESFGIPEFEIPGNLTVDRNGLHGVLEKTADPGSNLFSLSSGMFGLDITHVEVHFSAPVVNLQGKLHLFDSTINFTLDTLTFDGTNLRGKLHATGPTEFALVPGSDLVTISMDSLKGTFSTGSGTSLNFYGGFSMRLSSGSCGGKLSFEITSTGLNLTSFQSECDSLLSDIDLGWVHIGFRNLNLASLSYSSATGWDFNLNLDARFSFPYLDSLKLPWLENISLGTNGFHFPDISLDLSSLPIPAFNFGGFGLKPLAFRMDNFTFPWFDWHSGSPTGFNFTFDFEFTMPNLPDNFPDCIKVPDIRINNVNFAEGNMSFDLPLKVIDPPGCRIPLGDSVFFNILRLSGSFSASYTGGFNVSGGVDIRGNLSLPSALVCEHGEGQMDLTSYTLHFDSEGHVTGEISNIVPDCPLRFGPFTLSITNSNLNFRIEDGEQQVILDLDGTLKLPSPTPGDTVRASGSLTLELIHFRLIDGSLRITEPFVWNIPSESPVLAIRIDSALIDTAGFHIDGSGTLQLADGYSVGVNFDHLVLDLSNFNVKSGSANFTSSFAFKIDLSGGGMVWSAVQAGTALLEQGIMLNLPENIRLVQGGIEIRDTSQVDIIWNNTTYNVKAVFSDSFLISWTPVFGVSAGRVDFYFNNRRVAYLDSYGFHPDFEGIIPIPEKLPIPDTTIAYIKLKENDSLLVHYSYIGDTLRIYTEEGHPVYVYIPALKMNDFVPNFGVEFDVKVNPTSFEFLDGDVHARPPRGVDTLFTLTSLGLPLKVQGFDYINQNGTYGALLSASFTLPGLLDSLEITFDSLTITNLGLTGRASVGHVYDTLAPGATFIDSIVLGNFITFRVNGAEINFSPFNARFSGDIVPNFFHDEGGNRYPVHFVASVGTEGLDFDFDFPDSIPFELANFALQELDGNPPIDISIGDTFALELSGVLSLPFLGDSVQISLTGLKIMNVEPYVVCPTIHYPSPEQFFKLFGTQFGLMDITRDGTTYPALAFSYTDGALHITMSGEFEFLGDTITFTNLTVDTRGHFSFAYINLLSHPDTLIEPYWIVDTVIITMDSLKVAGTINLPPPFNETGSQRYHFTIGFDGTIRGGSSIALIDETPGLGGSDRTEFDFFVGTMDINYLALNIDLADVSNSSISAIFYFYFDRNRVIKIGDKEHAQPGLTIHFNGDREWGDISIPSGSIPDIDWEIFRMQVTGVSAFGDEGFGISLSGNFHLKVSSVEGGITFEDFRIDYSGHIDFPTITGADLTVSNLMTLSISDIDYRSLDHDTTLTIPTVTLPTRGDSGRSSTRQVTVRSYFSFGLSISLNIGDFGGGGGVDKFIAYTKSDGTTGFVIDNAHFSVPSTFDAHLDMEFEGGANYRFLFTGNANIPAANNTSVLVIGKLAHTDRGPSFGAFISVSTEIDIIPRLVILTSVGGGFFYNPEPEDIQLVKNKSGLTGEPFDTITVRPAKFAVFLYAQAKVVSDWAAEGRALLTVTDQEFMLDARVVILHMKDKIEGYAHLGIGFQDFYAQGNIGVTVNVVKLIEGKGTFDFYVYDTDAWGIMGGVDIKLFKFIDLSSDFFIGPPGFLLSSSAKFGFDIWIISVSAGFEGDIWYVQNISWGAYFKAYVSAEVCGGLAGAKGWLESALLGEPRFYLYGVAGVSVHVLFFSWDGSVWAKISTDGIDGGYGRDPEMEDLINQARETAHDMEEAKQEVQDAIASAQLSEVLLSPEEQARIFYSIFTSQFRIRGQTLHNLVYNNEITHGDLDDNERAVIQSIANGIYNAAHSPYGDTTEIVRAKGHLRIYIYRITRFQGAVNSLISSLNAVVDEINQANLTEIGDSPVRDKSFNLDVTINDSVAVVNSTPNFSIDEATLNQNRANAQNYERQAQELYQQVITRINQVEQALNNLDELLNEPVLDSLLKNYARADYENSKYYASLLNYNKRFRTWISRQRRSLQSRENSIRHAIHHKTARLDLPDIRSLVRSRKWIEFAILYHDNRTARDSAFHDFLDRASRFTDDQWRELADSTGMEIWYNIPMNGLAHLDSIFEANYDTAMQLYQISLDSIVEPHKRVTEAIDHFYDVSRSLAEVLYDLYDRFIYWLQGMPPESTMTPPMSGNTATVRFHNGVYVPRARFPSIGGGLTVTYAQLLEQYMAKIDSLGLKVTPPHISGIAVQTSNSGHMAPTIFHWNYHHRLGNSAIRDISYKILPPHHYVGSFQSTGKPGIITGNHRDFFTYYFFQRNNKTQANYKFYLRVRSIYGFSQIKRVPFTVYYENGGGGPGSTHSYNTSEDTTAPVMVSLQVPYFSRKILGPHRVSEEYYTPSTTTIYAEWSAYDPESDIEEYQYMITHPFMSYIFDPISRSFRSIFGEDTLVNWTSAHALTRFTIRNLSLHHNSTYRLYVKARNGAGLWSESRYLTIKVDTTPPPPPQRYTGFYFVPPVYGFTTPIPPRIYHRFAFVDDPESQTRKLLYRVDTIPHYHYDGTGWDTIPATQQYIQIIGDPIHYLDTFYISIVALNIVGLISDTAYVSPPLVPDDPSRPTPFEFDLSSVLWGRRYIRGSDTLIIHFSRLSDDPETGIKHYLFGIGSSRTTPNITGFSIVIHPDSISRHGLVTVPFDTSRINDGEALYFFIKAVNNDGDERQNVIGPYTLDKSPPPAPEITSLTYNPSTGNISLTFRYDDDPQSGIRAVGYEIWRKSDGHIVCDFNPIRGISPGLNTVTISPCRRLSPGTYTFKIVVKNGAYMRSLDSRDLEVRK